jgi:hypothetical protein
MMYYENCGLGLAKTWRPRHGLGGSFSSPPQATPGRAPREGRRRRNFFYYSTREDSHVLSSTCGSEKNGTWTSARAEVNFDFWK